MPKYEIKQKSGWKKLPFCEVEIDVGLVFKYEEDDVEFKEVFADWTSTDGDFNSILEMLCAVKEYFGVFYNKHHKKNLVIKIEDNKELL